MDDIYSHLIENSAKLLLKKALELKIGKKLKMILSKNNLNRNQEMKGSDKETRKKGSS